MVCGYAQLSNIGHSASAANLAPPPWRTTYPTGWQLINGGSALARAATNLGVDAQERADGRFRARAGHAAFGRNAKGRHVSTGRVDAGAGALDTVLGVHHPEIELGFGWQSESAK